MKLGIVSDMAHTAENPPASAEEARSEGAADTGDARPEGAADTGDARPEGAADTGEAHLTIEQLAAEVGMSVRNIRNHHTRGLLPPPEVRARVGFYSAEHVARLRLILDLQADGFNLTAIERLLSG